MWLILALLYIMGLLHAGSLYDRGLSAILIFMDVGLGFF